MLAWLGSASTALATATGAQVGVHSLSSVASLNGVACETQRECLAVGTGTNGKGVIVAISDGLPAKVVTVAGSDGLAAIACPGRNFCVAVGSVGTSARLTGAVIVPVRDGKPATAKVIKGTAAIPDAVSCHASASCWAVGGGGSIHIVNGKVAKVYKFAAGPPIRLGGIACSSATFCRVVGGYDTPAGSGIVGTLTDGKVKLEGVAQSLGVFGIACPGSSGCVIVGYGGPPLYSTGLTAVLRNGQVTKAHQLASTVLTAVACPGASSSCVAVGYREPPGAHGPLGGDVVRVTNDVPGKPMKVAGVSQLWGVACPSAGHCVAVGYHGQGKAQQGVVYAFR